jgi:hypothetical protein
VTIYTSHVKAGHPPVMVREGFCWSAAVFGWIWLLFHRAWVPAALLFATGLLVLRLDVYLSNLAPALALFLLQGVFGRDLWRWSLHLSGYRPGPPVAAADADGALARLLIERADLLSELYPSGAGPSGAGPTGAGPTRPFSSGVGAI